MANNSYDNGLKGGATDPDPKNNDISELLNVLREYIQSLSDADKELIKTSEEFKDLIPYSPPIPKLGSLSQKQLQRREEIKKELWKNKNRILIRKIDRERGDISRSRSLLRLIEKSYKDRQTMMEVQS